MHSHHLYILQQDNVNQYIITYLNISTYTNFQSNMLYIISWNNNCLDRVAVNDTITAGKEDPAAALACLSSITAAVNPKKVHIQSVY